MDPISADGQEGVLIYAGENYYFRVYDNEGDFTDYKILHSDLSIVIKDPDAYLYNFDDIQFLDHGPDTLGVKK